MSRNLIKALILLIPLTLAAEIFLRIPRQASTVLQNLGGSRVYQSPVKINGRAGSLTTFAFNESSDIISHRVARKLKLPPPSSQSTIILDTSGKSLSRYFIFKAPDLGNTCLVTALEQDARVFRSADNSPTPWPNNIPVLNATAAFSALCEKTGTTFLNADSHSSTPQQATDEAADALTQTGWKPALPTTPEFRIFTKGRQQCIVFSTQKPDSHQITINILQREGSKQ
ncbi:MAG: hypothetical protein PF904_18230 [Kiritimatiellae bacterium]|jgi:hypothetical protein|nr:hypothetical protein [Kiritimatiellia bacterium]